MIKKADIVREAVQKQDWKKALQIAKDFHIGVTQEERDKMARAYECIVHPDFYRQLGTDIPVAIEQGKTIVKEYAESKRKNSMKWDVKHDKAKRIIDVALDQAQMWFTDKEKIAGLTEEEVGEVNKELTVMIESIRKRYKLQVRLSEQVTETKPETEVPPETSAEEVKEDATKEDVTVETPVVPEKEEKPKRGRKPAGEKKAPARKLKTNKNDNKEEEAV